MLGQAVAAAATRLGHDVVALSRAELDITDADHVRRVVAAARAARGGQLRRVDRRRRRRDGRGRRDRRQRRRRGQRRARGAPRPARASCTSRPTTSSTAPSASRGSSPTRSNPIGAYGRSKLAGEEQVAAATDEHAIVRTAWLFGAGGRNFVDTMLALGDERDEVSVVTDQVGSPTWTVHLAEALVELAERGGDVGILHAAGGGACSWYELAVEVFDRAGVRCRVLPTTSDALPAARAAPRVLACSAPSATRRRVLPPWQDGVAALSEREGGGGPMRLLVCGGAGFIGSNFVRVRVRDHGDEVVVLDKLTYAGPAREPPGRRARVRPRRDRGPARGGRGDGRRRRGGQLRRRDPRRPLDRRARRLRPDARRRAPTCCSRPRARAACATCRSPPTRSTARSRRARSPRSRRWRPRRPTARPRPAPTCSSPATTTPSASRR